MDKVLMFNPTTFEQRWVPRHNAEEIQKLKTEQGFVENPRLVEMHNPRTNHTIPVMTQHVKLWEDKGYYAEPTMIYHPKDGTKMVSAADAKLALNHGWYASPAHFPGNDYDSIKTSGIQTGAGEIINPPNEEPKPKDTLFVPPPPEEVRKKRVA